MSQSNKKEAFYSTQTLIDYIKDSKYPAGFSKNQKRYRREKTTRLRYIENRIYKIDPKTKDLFFFQ